MNNPYYSSGQLKDKKIIEALKKLPDMYENGEIIEVRDLCNDIADAIDSFERSVIANGGM